MGVAVAPQPNLVFACTSEVVKHLDMDDVDLCLAMEKEAIALGMLPSEDSLP
jgi:hypothetical protein